MADPSRAVSTRTRRSRVVNDVLEQETREPGLRPVRGDTPRLGYADLQNKYDPHDSWTASMEPASISRLRLEYRFDFITPQ